MPRRNQSVGRRNSRRDRREKGIPRARVPEQPRVPLDRLILPDGQCFFQTPRKGKARFATKAKADAALVQAQQQRRRQGSTYVEKRVYECPEGGCGGWHLSSREAFDMEIWKQRRADHEKRLGGAS